MVEACGYAMERASPQNRAWKRQRDVAFEVAGVRAVRGWCYNIRDQQTREINVLNDLDSKYVWFVPPPGASLNTVRYLTPSQSFLKASSASRALAPAALPVAVLFPRHRPRPGQPPREARQRAAAGRDKEIDFTNWRLEGVAQTNATPQFNANTDDGSLDSYHRILRNPRDRGLQSVAIVDNGMIRPISFSDRLGVH